MAENFDIPDYIQELLKASAQGLEHLTHCLSNLLNLRVLITSSAYEMISVSFPLSGSESFHVMLKNPRKTNETLFLCNISSPTFQANAIGLAVAPVGKIIGYIFILVGPDHSDLETYQPFMNYAASLYSVHLQSRLELKLEQTKSKNAFLYDLLYGNLKQSEDIIITGNIWNWNFLQNHCLLLISLPTPEYPTLDQHLMDLLSRTVEKIYSIQFYRNPATLIRQNELAAVIPLQARSSEKWKEEILSFVSRILSHIDKSPLENKVTFGVGQPYGEPTDLFRSYQEAKVSLVMGTLLHLTVPFFSDLGLERILYKHDLQDLKEYYNHIWGELHKQDDTENSLIDTLESFADNNFDVNKTSQAIFMHRNSLRYRLNKIEDILGRSLIDVNTRLDIVATLKIKRLHRIDESD